MAIVLVAPRRAFASPGVRQLLTGVAITFATLSTSHPVALTILWGVSILATWTTIRSTVGGRTNARVYGLAMAAALACMISGTTLLVADPPWLTGSGTSGAAGGWLVAIAVMIRKGLVPFHSWYHTLFSHASLATALVVTMPQVATYTAVRMLVGHADGVPDELLMLSNAALMTAAYGLGQFAGPPLVALLLRHRATTGEGFTLSLEIAASALLVGAVIYAWMVRAYPVLK